jgi:hypothetical protein
MNLTMIDPNVTLADLYKPDITPEEAQDELPQSQAACITRAEEMDKAQKGTAACRAACEDDASMVAFLVRKEAETQTWRAGLVTEIREEHNALRDQFAIDEQVVRLSNATAKLNFYTTELEHWRVVRSGAHLVELKDAEANEAAAEFQERCQLAHHAYLRMVVSAKEAYIEAGGPVGIISPRVQELKADAAAAGKRWESAVNAAQEQRQRYDNQLRAWVNRGFVTRQQVGNAVAQF